MIEKEKINGNYHEEKQWAFIKAGRSEKKRQQVKPTHVALESVQLHNFRHDHSKELKSCLFLC